MTKKQTQAQGQVQTQSHPISVPLSYGTLHFENATDARKFVSIFSFHSRAAAQALIQEIEKHNEADRDLIFALGYLNKDLASLLCTIEFEIGGAA